MAVLKKMHSGPKGFFVGTGEDLPIAVIASVAFSS